MGHDVVCVVGHTTCDSSFPLPDVRLDESPGGMLNESIQLANTSPDPQFWIHAAAILDYEPEYNSGKIPSGIDNWNIELFPTKKHLQVLKGHVRGSKRIGFKLEVGVDEDTLISKSMGLISDNELEAVVANLLDEVHNSSSKRCRIVYSNGNVESIEDLSGLCEKIEGIIASN
jgi:phosphopantothenoylcysteine synthetase/decarboxylase